MNLDVIHPDSYNKMNVENVKIIFEQKTQTAGHILCEDILNIKAPLHYSTIERLNFYKDSQWPEQNSIKNPIATLEFMYYVEQLYINFAIKSELFITMDNYEYYLQQTQNIMKDFFGSWKKNSAGNASNFISPQTYFNMRLSFKGIFLLFKLILDKNPGAGISITRGNTSAIELVFCRMRNICQGKPDAMSYTQIIATIAREIVDGKLDPQLLKNAHSYRPEDVNGDNSTASNNIISVNPKTATAVKNKRKKICKSIEDMISKKIEQILSIKPPGNNIFVNILYLLKKLYLYIIIIFNI